MKALLKAVSAQFPATVLAATVLATAAGLAFVLSATPAQAQGMPGGPQSMPGPDGSGKHRGAGGTGTQGKDQDKKPKVDDKEYRSAIDRLPDQKFDPWRNTR